MADRVIFVCILLLAGVYFYATEQLPSLEIGDPLGPKAFPRLLGVTLLITAAILLLELLRAQKRKVARPAPQADQSNRGAYVVIALVTVSSGRKKKRRAVLKMRIGMIETIVPHIAHFNRWRTTA